jgi:hypothetical protein
MTASQKAKELGFKNLAQVQELSGQSQQTLDNWLKKKPLLFKVVLLGCLAKLNEQAVSDR